jgi:hypothetical protein
MKQLALVLSAFVAIIGAIGFIRPDTLIGVARHFETPAGLYAAAGLRILLGVALLLAAATSRTPRVIRVIGAVVLAAGFVTPFFGPERARAIVDWWSSQRRFVMRAWAGFAVGFGGFLVWALLPKSRERTG